MHNFLRKYTVLVLALFAGMLVMANEHSPATNDHNEKPFVVREFILEHVGDSYIVTGKQIGRAHV